MEIALCGRTAEVFRICMTAMAIRLDFYIITDDESEPVEAFMAENKFDFPLDLPDHWRVCTI